MFPRPRARPLGASAGWLRRPEYGGQIPTPEPVREDFTVVTELEIIVTGTQTDDHGDTPQTATALDSTNENMAGKIDRPDD